MNANELLRRANEIIKSLSKKIPKCGEYCYAIDQAEQLQAEIQQYLKGKIEKE